MRTLAFLFVLTSALDAHAQGVGLPVFEIEGRTLRVDGLLRDWRGVRFVEVGDGDDAAFDVALGYDQGALYVGARIADQRLVRSRSPGADEDALIVTLALPGGATEVWLYAGVSGRSPASGAIGRPGGSPRASSAVEVVEAPAEDGGGYALEARIPWSAIAGGSRWQRGRGAVRYRDVDQESRPEVEAEPSTAPVDPRALDRLPLLVPQNREQAVLDSFLADQGAAGSRPRFDLRGDVSGDDRPERVVVVHRFVVVMGPGYRDGSRYDFAALPVEGDASVRDAELRDLTGDGKRELLVTMRQRNDQGARDLWQVFSFPGERVQPVFAIELRKEARGGSIEAELRIERGRPPVIETRIGRARGLDASSYEEAPASDAEPILLPWGPQLYRRYRWDGTRFSPAGEAPNPRAEAPRAPAPRARPNRPPPVEEPEQPAAPNVDQILAHARRELDIPRDARPRFRRSANLAEDATAEQLVVFGRKIVVVGAHFRQGRGYFVYEVPLASDDDLLDVDASDVTGDGRAEVIIRARQTIGDVVRELLLVHRFVQGGRFERTLAVEIARRQGESEVQNEIAFTGRGASRTLVLRPGRARGWDARSYPFADGDGSDGVRPILLPWRDREVRFRFADGRLSPG